MPRESIHSSSASNSTSISSESKSNRKYWGDEESDDAIYSVYLKKITYSGHPAASATRSSAYFQSSAFSPFHDTSLNCKTLHVPSSSDSSTASDLVDGFQRVFRRRSSFDKQSMSRDSSVPKVTFNGKDKKSNRSASVASALNHLTRSSTASDFLIKQKSDLVNVRMNYSKCDDDVIDSPATSSHRQRKSESQMLQWETRQIKILKAATLQHIIQYILMATPRQLQLAAACASSDESCSSHCQSVVMEEEKNNVSHIIHIIFVSYRLFSPPELLFHQILEHFNAIKPQPPHLVKQFNFLLHYWLSNYPEDFATVVKDSSVPSNGRRCSSSSGKSDSLNQINCEASSITSDESFSQLKSLPASNCNSNDSKSKDTSCPSSTASSPSLFIRRRSKSKERRKKLESGVNKSINRSMSSDSRGLKNHKPTCNQLVDVLLKLPDVDRSIYRKALSVMQDMKEINCDLSSLLIALPPNGKYTNNQQSGGLLDLEPRLIASQLTTIDLDNFVTLKAYHLLEGTRSTVTVQNTVKYFNLLSRQVVISILNSNCPDVVTIHWIDIALQLRRMKNFNSLKAVISGLTNESIYRLKNVIWCKLNKSTMANFKMLSSIVDDVDNQSVLRQTQLEMTKSSDNSFGTIPYLGTFFTDLTVIDSRYTTTFTSKANEKLINLEKCSKQFEVITQVQLLQKNVRASLNAHLKAQCPQNDCPIDYEHRRPPLIKSLARVLREWFEDDSKEIMSENDCYKLSLSLEPLTPRK